MIMILLKILMAALFTIAMILLAYGITDMIVETIKIIRSK